jgi:hypothetical protein
VVEIRILGLPSYEAKTSSYIYICISENTDFLFNKAVKPFIGYWLLYVPPGFWIFLYITHLFNYILRKICTMNSIYFPIQHSLTDVSNGSTLCSVWGTN